MSNNDNENNAFQFFGYGYITIYKCTLHYTCIVIKKTYSVKELEMYIAMGKQSYPFGDKCYNYIFNTIGENNWIFIFLQT